MTKTLNQKITYAVCDTCADETLHRADITAFGVADPKCDKCRRG